uniref:Syntaxin-7 n=1 Tax=Fundulus heteroclitus TaxID=8078 RepID=A0A3Q2TQ61_FUNHE
MAYHAGIQEDPNVLVQNISSNIQRITQLKTNSFRKLNVFLRISQQKQQQGNLLAKDTDKLMKVFTSLPIGPDQRQRKLQKERLLNDFSAALNSLQKTQRQAADKEREFVARVRAGSRLSVSECYTQVQAQTEVMTEEDLILIKERESAIRQLESDITDINDIFKDLGMMVHEQGDMIDSIEANVESADTNIQAGTQQLARAADYQRSSRKKMCILMVVLAVVAVVIGLIIWGSLKK